MYGPYRTARGRWRIVVVSPGGSRADRVFATERQAKAALRKAEAALQTSTITIEQGVDLYLEHQTARGLAPVTVTTSGYRLGGLLDPAMDLELADMGARRCQRLYDERVKAVKPGTHRSELNEVKMWSRWLVKRGYLDADPWSAVEPVGKANRGKPQLTIDEARKLSSHCLGRTEDPGAVGTLICLGLGLRASEVCALTPRDLDDGGRVLIVRGTKTASARRNLSIPEWLRPVLADALPLRLTRFGLRSRVRTLCRNAGVPEVSPHGLRGTHATLASAAGAASEYVAASLGHTSSKVTERHYSTGESVASGRAARAGLKLVK